MNRTDGNACVYTYRIYITEVHSGSAEPNTAERERRDERKTRIVSTLIHPCTSTSDTSGAHRTRHTVQQRVSRTRRLNQTMTIRINIQYDKYSILNITAATVLCIQYSQCTRGSTCGSHTGPYRRTPVPIVPVPVACVEMSV